MWASFCRIVLQIENFPRALVLIISHHPQLEIYLKERLAPPSRSALLAVVLAADRASCVCPQVAQVRCRKTQKTGINQSVASVSCVTKTYRGADVGCQRVGKD